MKKKYNIAFVGLGSIGKRHLKNVCSYIDNQGKTYTIDAYRNNLSNRLDKDIEKLISKQYHIDDIKINNKKYDVVFITNPTSKHVETLRKFIDSSNNFFIEKPVTNDEKIDKKLLEKIKHKKCYVACPLKYNNVVKYIKEKINISEVYSIRAISSSYLPNWRKGIDYRKTYSAQKKLGGGVNIDLIHEWDYINWIFGKPNKVYSIIDKVSDLEIDSNDIAVYIAKINNTIIELHLDYFGRYESRKITLYTKKDVIECDLLNGRIEYKKSKKLLLFDNTRNNYQMEEIKYFFDLISNNRKNINTIENALAVLQNAKGKK